MSEWNQYSFSEIATIKKGVNYSSSDYSNEGSSIPFISIKCLLKGGGFDYSGIKYLKDRFNSSDKLKPGELLFSITDLTRDGDIVGSPLLVPEMYCGSVASMDLIRVEENKDIVDIKFLYYLMMTKSVRSYFINHSAGSTVLHLEVNSIPKLKLNFPILSVQRKITHILSTIDSIIEKTQSAIDKYKAIKQGMLQDLFTCGIDIKTGKLRPRYEDVPELYKESKLGWIPKEWDENKVVDVAKVNGRVGWKGYTVSDLRDIGALVLGATHIDKENKLDLSKPVHISEDKYLESPEIMIHFGDIIIVQRGTIGKIAIIDREIGDATINPSMVLLNNIRTDNYFLYYQLCSFIGLRQIESLTSQTGVPMISQEQINNIKIAIPKDKIEAAKIAKRITSVDSTLYSEISHLHKLQMLKSGLMSDLLSGKKRVKVDNEDLSKTA